MTLIRASSPESLTVNLTRTNYTGSITLSVTPLPSGVSATFTQPGRENSGRVTLKAASNIAPVNNQTITIIASGSGVPSVSATLPPRLYEIV